MDHSGSRRKTGHHGDPAVPQAGRADGVGRTRADGGLVPSGSIMDLHGTSHRVLAHVAGRVLLTDLLSHHAYLVQEADEAAPVLPRLESVLEMLADGRARILPRENTPTATNTERMRAQIEMLDAASVRQGEKAIWIHLTRHWTPEHVACFGPFDDPCKIKRWRAALRRAAR